MFTYSAKPDTPKRSEPLPDEMLPVAAAIDELIAADEAVSALDAPEFRAVSVDLGPFRMASLDDNHPLADIEVDTIRRAQRDAAANRLAAARAALAAAVREYFAADAKRKRTWPPVRGVVIYAQERERPRVYD